MENGKFKIPKEELRKRFAFDLDGTLTKHALFPNIFDSTPTEMYELYANVEPDKQMIEYVNQIYDSGHIVFIFTSRWDLYERVTKKWLDKWGVKHHYFICNKPYFDCFVDDKAINNEQFKTLMRCMK